MPDETTRAIDRFFDTVDDGIEKVGRVLNRTARAEEHIRSEAKRRVIIDTDAHDRGKASTSPKSSSATAAGRPRYRIVESIDPKSGNTLFVVTDGSSRTECTSREFAQQILRSLEKTP